MQKRASTRLTDPMYLVVADEMNQVRQCLTEELTGEAELVDTLCRYVADYQGKMLRSAILLLAGKAGGQITPRHLQFAVVIELVHLATLIHDDVLDEATVRRNVAAVNQLWGNETSVLLGDLLLSKAFDLCNRTGDLKAAEQISQTAKVICRGELLQCMTRNDQQIDEERYFQIIEMKTASLYQLCCRLGAMLADASPDHQAALENYGRLIGCGFQIADDLLDIAGNEDQAGKTLGTDLIQKKITLPFIHYYRTADPDSRERMISLFHRQAVARAEVRELLDRTGSLSYASQRAQEMVRQARKCLQTLEAGPARDALANIADFVVRRTC